VSYAGLKAVMLCHYGRTGYNVLRALRGLGAEVYAVVDRRSASLRYSLRCKVIHVSEEIDHADPEEVQTKINDLHRREFIDSVLACDVESLRLLSRIKPRLLPKAFPAASIDMIELLNNKWDFHQLCCKTQVRTPHTLFFPSKSAIDCARVGSEIGFPAVIKPAAGYGQRGIVIPANLEALHSYMSAPGDTGEIIIQKFVSGVDWAISVFAIDGTITHWTAWACPGQLEESFGVGRFLTTNFVQRHDLFEAASRLMAATNFSGCANLDARLDDADGTMKMFECNPRFFGRLSASRLCGLDFVKAGMPVEDRQSFVMHGGFYYPWQELLNSRGWKQILAGRWQLRQLAWDMQEMIADPIPLIMRKITNEDLLR
jgi:predicted ATP-grasp superfamily ATP-dependent carboligase